MMAYEGQTVMTVGEVMSWAIAAGYQCEHRMCGLQLHEPVFLFFCTRCDHYLESTSGPWAVKGQPDFYAIPPWVAWDLGTHMAGHLVLSKMTGDPRRLRVGTERRLTANEVGAEVAAIRTRPWPHLVTLLMKNLYDGSTGRILRGDKRPETIRPEVHLMEVSNPQSGAKWGSKVGYPSLEKMVEAGWVVD